MLKHERILKEIRTRVTRNRNGFLPPVRELCRMLDASPVTVSRALHVLRDEGLIVIRPGGSILVPGAGEFTGPAGPAATAFAAMITAQLDSNAVKAGDVFPKIGYYVKTMGLSPNTVCTGFGLLAARKRVHKRGRLWVAGTASDSVALKKNTAGGVHTGPFVLLIFHELESWSFYQRTFFYRDCFRRMFRELRGRGVGVRMVFEKQVSSSRGVVSGWKEVSAFVRANRAHIEGIFMGHGGPFTKDELRWLQLAGSTGKKTVVLEGWDQPSAAPAYGKRFYRAAIHEEPALMLALRQLHERGHVRVAFVMGPDRPERLWQMNRLRMLTTLAEGMTPSMQILPVMTGPVVSVDGPAGTFLRPGVLLRQLPPAGTPETGNPETGQPELHACLQEGGVTALIASNDICATNLYLWLRAGGYDVPRDVSLIGFDNSPYEALYPVSTVDFNFEELGYAVAHTLLGDIPGVSDRQRNVFAAPEFVERGSVAAVRGQ